MPFQIRALPKSSFENLFTLSAQELGEARALRMLVNTKPGFPCRISLVDAEIGEEVILVHYEHQNANTPFRGSHAVFVRENVEEARLAVNEVPQVLRTRILSLRAFDEGGMMAGADLADGSTLEQGIHDMFENARVAYIHIHFAKPGCYAARVDRA